jgi:hypothetical protein
MLSVYLGRLLVLNMSLSLADLHLRTRVGDGVELGVGGAWVLFVVRASFMKLCRKAMVCNSYDMGCWRPPEY